MKENNDQWRSQKRRRAQYEMSHFPLLNRKRRNEDKERIQEGLNDYEEEMQPILDWKAWNLFLRLYEKEIIKLPHWIFRRTT